MTIDLFIAYKMLMLKYNIILIASKLTLKMIYIYNTTGSKKTIMMIPPFHNQVQCKKTCTTWDKWLSKECWQNTGKTVWDITLNITQA